MFHSRLTSCLPFSFADLFVFRVSRQHHPPAEKKIHRAILVSIFLERDFSTMISEKILYKSIKFS